MKLFIENSRKLELVAEDIIIVKDTDALLSIKLIGADSSSIRSETQMEATVLAIPSLHKSWKGTSVSISSSDDEVIVELSKASMNRRKVIIDTDGGIDDAVAILEALREPTLDILGITTLYSNTTLEHATDNALRLLKLAGRDHDIPVAAGESMPLSGIPKAPSSLVHGENGLGNVELPESDVEAIDMHAVDFIISKANEFPGEITVVTLGPLTNIARALERCPELPKLLDRLIVMGGAVGSPGNVSACSEANIHADSLSARIVFNAGFNLYMVGLNVTTKVHITGAMLDYIGRHQSCETLPYYNLISRMLPFYFDFYRRMEDLFDMCPVHDPLAMMVAIDPSVCSFRELPVSVIVSDDITNGMTLADLRHHPSETHRVNVAVDVDSEKAIGKLLKYFCI